MCGKLYHNICVREQAMQRWRSAPGQSAAISSGAPRECVNHQFSRATSTPFPRHIHATSTPLPRYFHATSDHRRNQSIAQMKLIWHNMPLLNWSRDFSGDNWHSYTFLQFRSIWAINSFLWQLQICNMDQETAGFLCCTKTGALCRNRSLQKRNKVLIKFRCVLF